VHDVGSLNPNLNLTLTLTLALFLTLTLPLTLALSPSKLHAPAHDGEAVSWQLARLKLDEHLGLVDQGGEALRKLWRQPPQLTAMNGAKANDVIRPRCLSSKWIGPRRTRLMAATATAAVRSPGRTSAASTAASISADCFFAGR
jgi:hypothetical protein